NIPELCVRKAYRNLFEEIREKKNISKNERKIAMDFVRQKVTAAEWFIESLNQRENTLFRTMESIIDYQRTFFQTGDETTIKPMILKNIAEKIGMNISTVSRITSSKYVLTPYGMYPLKFFFSESMEKEGEEVSSREIKKIIQDTIQEEDKNKPLTDDELRNILKKKGYNIARRTVAKYREQMGFMPSRMRK
ncbi:MAG: RNA polymerase sigma-54 factor, partial [Bacteroidales bacterium]|nr:RNA polymerase sigma-54 factor [Bacteroidales bacterium]